VLQKRKTSQSHFKKAADARLEENDLVAVEDLGHALAAGIDFGIF
jgi:hypothetical protein